jgi:hypothetical protein
MTLFYLQQGKRKQKLNKILYLEYIILCNEL